MTPADAPPLPVDGETWRGLDECGDVVALSRAGKATVAWMHLGTWATARGNFRDDVLLAWGAAMERERDGALLSFRMQRDETERLIAQGERYRDERDAMRAEVEQLRITAHDLAYESRRHLYRGQCPEYAGDPARDEGCVICSMLPTTSAGKVEA